MYVIPKYMTKEFVKRTKKYKYTIIFYVKISSINSLQSGKKTITVDELAYSPYTITCGTFRVFVWNNEEISTRSTKVYLRKNWEYIHEQLKSIKIPKSKSSGIIDIEMKGGEK